MPDTQSPSSVHRKIIRATHRHATGTTLITMQPSLLLATLLPSTVVAFVVPSRGVLPLPGRARFGIVAASEPLSKEQNTALVSAAKSSKYYTPLNRSGGQSSDTWTAVRAEYPELEGISDDALVAAFAVIKRAGAGSRVPEVGGSAFETLLMPQKVALVRVVRGSAYAAAMEAAGGASAEAWAAIMEDSPDLAGLTVDTLDAATAELLASTESDSGQGVASAAPPLSSVLVPIALVAFIYVSITTLGSAPDDSRLSRANSMVQENTSRWAAKNLPAQ